MSIPVEVAELATRLADYGSGYLLTVSSSGRVKAVSAAPRVVDGILVVAAPGQGSVTNIERNPAVTLLFPPPQPGGHTLLVDGIAALDRREAELEAVVDVRVEPHHAVLHRPAAPGEGDAA